MVAPTSSAFGSGTTTRKRKNALNLPTYEESQFAQVLGSRANVPASTSQDFTAGSYDPKQKAFMTTGGEKYPTSNPDFRPTDRPDKTVTFNDDNSVTVSSGTKTPSPLDDKTQTLTRQEYNTAKGTGGSLTNAATAGRDIINPQPVAPTQPNIDLMSQEEIQAQSTGVDLTGGVLGDVLSGGAQVIEKLSSYLPEALRFGTSKDVDVKKAEAGFADYAAVLDQQIKLYQEGKIPASTIERTFKDAEQEIINLQATTKGMGQVDLRFWLDKGREIEAQIAREISLLETKKASLGLV